MAAIEMQAIIKEYEKSLSHDKKHFMIKLNGVGLHCGKGLIIDK